MAGVVNTVAGGPRPPFGRSTSCGTSLVLTAGYDDETFMTRNLNVTPKTTEQRI